MDQSVLLRLAEGGSKAANCTSFTATEVEVAVEADKVCFHSLSIIRLASLYGTK